MLDSSSTSAARTYAISRATRRRGWLICSSTLLLLVIAARWFLSRHSFPGDDWAARVGASPKPWLVYTVTRAYQQVGRPLVAVGEVLAMIAWLWRIGGRRAAHGLMIALLASATCGLIKTICGPTPLWLSLHHVGTDFPSGVVTFVTAAGGYLSAVAWTHGRRIVPAVLVTVIAGAGPARILGGQHVLSDVVGGYLLGAAWLIIACVYMTGARREARAGVGYRRLPRPLRVPGLALGAAVESRPADGSAQRASDELVTGYNT